MGIVIPFPRRIESKLPLEELELLTFLRDSFQVAWHNGWADAGAPHGVALLKGERLIGTWSHDDGIGFTFWPAGDGAPTFQVWTVHGAHQYSVALLTRPDPGRSIA